MLAFLLYVAIFPMPLAKPEKMLAEVCLLTKAVSCAATVPPLSAWEEGET